MVESGAPRLTDGCGERLRGPTNRCREPSALSKAGWSTIRAGLRQFGRRRCTPTSCWKGRELDSASHHHTASSRLFDAERVAVGLTVVRDLGRLPAGESERQAVGQAGCLAAPNAKGSGSVANAGALRLLRGARLRRGGHARRSVREAPSGLRLAPAGLRGKRGAWGEKASAAAGRWK
jgi:hypothetical protein